MPAVITCGGVLFLSFKMAQNFIDDVLIFDACDDSGRFATAGADLDKVNRREASSKGALGHVYIEHALESLSPSHTRYSGAGSSGMALSGGADL